MGGSKDNGVLVETGGFRIDRRRALEKMRAYQLSDPARFLLFALRAAEAAGASRVDVESIDHGLRVRFNGKAFAAKRIDEPFGVLFEQRAKGPSAARQFAIAALGFLRYPNGGILLSSGNGVRPRAVKIASTLEATPRRDAVRPDRSWWTTQIIFKTEGGSKKWTAAAFALARADYRFGSAAVTIDKTRLEESGGFVDHGMPGFMARLRRAENLDALDSTVSVYYLGVYLCEFAFEASWAQVAGDVRFDRADLDISEAGLTGEARKRLTESLSPAVRLLVRRETGIQNERIGEIGRALENHGLRRRWGNRLDSFDGAATYLMTRLGISVFKDLAQRERFRDDLHRTVWLRGACAGRLKKFEREKRSEPARSLWRCKAFVATSGKPLSVLDIERERLENSGRVRAARVKEGRWHPVDVVWTPAEHDLAALRAIFGKGRIALAGE